MAPATIIATLSSWAWVRPSSGVLVAADELDEEALGPGVDQVDREEDAGAEAVAEPPEDEAPSPIASVS